MAKYLNQKLRWKVAGRRHWIRSILLICAGPFLGMMAAGLILEIDNTASANHTTTAQDVVGAVAMIVGFGVLFALVVPGVRRLRRFAVAGTDDYLIVTAKRRATIPYTAIAKVIVMTPADEPTVRVPAVVLSNGEVVPIPDARSRNEEGTTLTLTVEPGSTTIRTDHPWKVARKVLDHLPTVPTGVVAPLAAVTASSATQVPGAPSVTNSLIERTTTLPGAATVKLSDQEIGGGKMLWGRAAPMYLVLAVIFGFRAQAGSGHAFNVAQFALVFAAVLVAGAVVLFLSYRVLVAEIQVGPDWLAVRRFKGPQWSVLHRDGLAGVVAVKPTKRNANAGGSLRFSDAVGQSIVVPGTWLREPLATQIGVALDETQPLWSESARQALHVKSAGALPPSAPLV